MKMVSVKAKYVLAAAAASAYVFLPAYRYYVIGSYIAYKIVKDKPRARYYVVSKASRDYKRLVGAAWDRS